MAWDPWRAALTLAEHRVRGKGGERKRGQDTKFCARRGCEADDLPPLGSTLDLRNERNAEAGVVDGLASPKGKESSTNARRAKEIPYAFKFLILQSAG